MGVVPNFSEGRRGDVIDAIVAALRVPGARVVYAEADPDHNRSVFTVVGSERRLIDALLGGGVVVSGPGARHHRAR